MSGDLSERQRTLLAHFANTSEVIQKRQAQVETLGAERRDIARRLREVHEGETQISVTEMAKAAGVGAQAVYKLLQS